MTDSGRTTLPIASPAAAPLPMVLPVPAAMTSKPASLITVSPMRRRHLRGVLAIEQQASSHPWSIGLFLGELRMPTSRCYNVALDRHVVVGLSGLMYTGEEGHITNIAVHPDYLRLGIASEMLVETMKQAVSRGVTAVTLEVRASNTAAHKLYQRFGFAPGGVRRNYYADPREDALIMWAQDVDTKRYAERLLSIASGLRQFPHQGDSE
ncbi:MAG: ribosomal protein S18-alanine N-acetyltransferase [Microthrixaceae bacterium]